MTVTAKQLAADLAFGDVSGTAGVKVSSVACDSHQVRPGTVFVAIPGARTDGWAYVDEAITRGASVVVSEHAGPAHGAGACYIRVPDARRALAAIAGYLQGWPARQLCVVGITGTNGKTTTATMIRDVLKKAGRSPGMLGTIAYEIGNRIIPAQRTTPDAVMLQQLLAEMVATGCRSAVLEVSSHALSQQRVSGIDFAVGVFTNLTHDHLDYHADMQQYFATKAMLFQALPASSFAVIGVDNDWGRRLYRDETFAAARLSFGTHSDVDLHAGQIELGADGCRFVARTPWGSSPVVLKLLGRFNVSNALAALGACGALGIPLETAVSALQQVSRVPGRLEVVPTGRDMHVFVDYAHTDDALSNALVTLRELTRRRLIVVFGCGGDRDRTKRPAMGRVAESLADVVVVTSDNPRTEDAEAIMADILRGIASRRGVQSIPDRAEAIAWAIGHAKDGDVVLIAGKGHEQYQEIGKRMVPFDDRQKAKEALDVAL